MGLAWMDTSHMWLHGPVVGIVMHSLVVVQCGLEAGGVVRGLLAQVASCPSGGASGPSMLWQGPTGHHKVWEWC